MRRFLICLIAVATLFAGGVFLNGQLRNSYEIVNISRNPLVIESLIVGRTKNWSWCGMSSNHEFCEGPHCIDLKAVIVPPGQTFRVTYLPARDRGLEIRMVRLNNDTDYLEDQVAAYQGWGYRKKSQIGDADWRQVRDDHSLLYQFCGIVDSMFWAVGLQLPW